MANIRRMYLRAEMSDGDTVELLNFTVGSDGKVQKLDESSLDTLLDTPKVAKMCPDCVFAVEGPKVPPSMAEVR